MASPDDIDVWIGLDIGKTGHAAWVLDGEGAELFARAVANDEADLDGLLDRAAEHGTAALVVDQPGSLARLVLAVAGRRGTPVAYVPGLVMRRAADLYPGEAKTDRRDAYVLAETARTRRRQVHWLDASDDELLEQLRVLNGYDADLAADATRLSNRLRDALTSVSPALERVLGPRLQQRGVRDLLARYGAPQALSAAGRGRIERTLRKRSPRSATALAAAVLEALDAQTVVVPAEATTGRVIAELAAELERTLQRRARLEGELAKLFEAHPFGRILGTLPGVGPRTGSRILAEIGDGAAFADGSRLASYAGLAPVTRQSGSSLHGESRSRRGNRRLKNAMFLSAFASLRDPASRAFYDRKRAEGKKHNAAIICLARRRCDVILAMLHRRAPYRYRAPREMPAAA
ncbi:MAG: IS110 family transposase [Dehalococcoidia bacterium]|nr:IS110 family transposase [Dehalococcoidia bacterium]